MSNKNKQTTETKKPSLFLKRLSYYIAIKNECDSWSNLGLIAVGSASCDNGVLDAKLQLCELIHKQGGNLLTSPGFVPSQNGKTSYGNGSGYRGWKNFGSQENALRYLAEYFDLTECNENLDYGITESEAPQKSEKPDLSKDINKQSQKFVLHQVQILAKIGFKDAAQWEISDDRKILDKGDDEQLWKEIKEAKNALYAFCVDGNVLYIGKTARSLEKRFIGYRDPGNTQATNRKCHDEIRKILNEKKSIVRIMVFPDQTHLHWGDFRISLSAGLEDALIEYLKPPLNGLRLKKKKQEIYLTESDLNEDIASFMK